MKLFHLLALMSTGLSFIHAADYKKHATVVISVSDAVRDETSVYAKKFSEGEKSEMRVDPGREPWCLGIPDPITEICSGPEYVGITDILFDRPTTKPRPVSVKFKDYTIECTFALNQAMDGRVVAWEIHRSWGLDGRKSDFQIECDNSTAFYGEPYGTPESEMPPVTAVWPHSYPRRQRVE